MKRTIFLAFLMLTTFSLVLTVTVQPAPAANSPIFEHEYVVVRAYFTDRQMVDAVAEWREPWDVDYNKNIMIIDVTADEYMKLLDLGFTLEIDEALTAEFNQPNLPLQGQMSGIPGYPCYRTVEETFATAQDIVAQHPDFATWIDIGDSWEKTAGLGGYDLMVLRLTNSNVTGPKPKLFIMSSVHAREYTPAELNTRFAEYLINNYGIDADATWLLDHNEIHMLLQANPDGRKQAETGLSWRKNTNQNYCLPTPNSRGVDLNRNFPYEWGEWGGSSGNQCSSTYRGPSSMSDPETQAVVNYVQSEFEDTRPAPENDFTTPAYITTTGIFLDIHSYSELVLWPWGFTANPTGNNDALVSLGRKFAYFNDYYPEQAIGLYVTDGTTDDFAYGDMGLPAYTFELGTSFFQACGVFESTILPDNMEALIYAAKALHAPYLEPAGPDALDLALAFNPVEAGTAVTLTATLNDTRYNNQNGTEPTQNIAAAEYYIDVPPWVTTTVPVSGSMTAVDGNFNNPIEAAQGVLDTTNLSDGRHTIFVRGQDANGSWGVLSAIFLYVVDPAVAPVIAGNVYAADTGFPLQATIDANDIFQTTTDANGGYQMLVISDTYTLAAVPNDPIYASTIVTGIVAHDLQTVQQDFLLYPICDIFSDDVESGTNGWTADSPWAITTENAQSPTHSWTDSPGGNYGNNLSISLTSPILDLSTYEGISLNYWQICDTEAGYDFCNVEASTDGVNWTAIASYDGNNSQWEEINLDLGLLSHQATAQIRFHFTTDINTTDDGWHIDDITLRGAGANCVGDTAPTAAFISSSPDALGQATQFINNSTGTNLAIEWDFGDGSPVDTTVNPSHTYAMTGTYTVVLTATNNLGSDTTTGLVHIQLAPVAAFEVYSPVILGNYADFTNTSTGDDLTFFWEFGDGTTSTVANPGHLYMASGVYTVTLTVDNEVGSDVATATVAVWQAPDAGFINSSSPAPLGTTTVFTNTSTGDNLQFVWDFGDGITSTLPSPTHTYAASGVYTATLTASNEIGSDTTESIIAVWLAPAAAFSSSSPDTIGATTVFTNSSTGDNLQFLWDFGDNVTSTLAAPTHVYATAGVYTVTLTVSNEVGIDSVTAVVEITAVSQPQFTLYLPAVIREP